MLKLDEYKELQVYKKIYYFDKESKDHIIYRFKILESLGSGSFSNVYKTYDYKNKNYNAIKIIKNYNLNNNELPKEVSILSNLRQKEKNNISKLFEYFIFRGKIHIVFKLYDITLHSMIYDNKYRQKLELNRKKYIIQLISAIDYLNKNNIVHSDLKPNNIVLKDSFFNDVILIDFGCAQITKDGLITNKKYSCDQNKLQTVSYRAPEIVMNILFNLNLDCNYKIDMWSLGCIVYELFLFKRLFDTTVNIDLFINFNILFDHPDYHFLKNHKKLHQFYDDIESPSYITYNNKIYSFKNDKFIEKHSLIDNKIIDLILKCCKWSEEKRINCNEALKLIL